MGPFLFSNAALAGFFAFGGIYHFILWSRTRHVWTFFAFAMVCLGAGLTAYAILQVGTAQTVEQGQWALNLRNVTAISQIIALTWLFPVMSGFRARVFPWLTTTVLVITALAVMGGIPLTGTVTGIERVTTAWGETLSVLTRDSPSLWLVPVYVSVFAVMVFALMCSRHLWARDRVGGALLAATTLGYLITVVVGLAVDLFGAQLPYAGPLVSATWIVPIAWQVARANQHQAERLVATERRFRAIFDQTFQFIGLLNVEGTLLEANQTALDFAGVRPGDVIGKPFWETPWWNHSPDLQDRLRQAIRAAARGEIVRFEVTHPGRDGQLHHIDFSLKPVYDANGAVILLIPEGRDITNRVVAEEAKRKLEQQLLQAQKLEALGQLAGGIAHDFNNLLTVIAGHTDMLLSDNGDHPAHHDLQQIRQASDRAASMTRQLLAFSRQSVLEPKVINLNLIVRQMETMLRRSIGEDIELVVRAAPDAHHVKADPDQLGRALLNIAINARDAMPDGGTLLIETKNVELLNQTASGTADAGTTSYVLLAMSDTGCGMTPETRSRLFEPFYTTKEQGKGTGLGLAVVDGIVKQSGGRIEVYSEPGAGTTFKIYLPATDGQDTDATVSQETRPARGRETVLLVEDEPAVREMTHAALQRHGYTVLPAASGAEALQIARANHGAINVVLTDVVMPGMSGPQLVERLREDQPQLAALFMSGYTSDAVLRHGIETGEADFLQKPFSTSALAAKLRQVLDR